MSDELGKQISDLQAKVQAVDWERFERDLQKEVEIQNDLNRQFAELKRLHEEIEADLCRELRNAGMPDPDCRCVNCR